MNGIIRSNFYYFCKKLELETTNQVREVINNDWITYGLLTVVCIYLFIFYFLQSKTSLKDYLLQEKDYASNPMATWFFTTLAYLIVSGLLISTYIPFVPIEIREHTFFDFELTKFGYVFGTFCILFLIKTALSYTFFQSLQSGRKWKPFYYYATKLEMVFSFVLFIMTFISTYTEIDRFLFFQYIIVLYALITIIRSILYLFNKHNLLPDKWYYKFLYICTFQISPLLVMWKILF